MSTAAPAVWTAGIRLPSHVVPSKYDVALAPDLIGFTFQGQVRIALDVATATQDVVCHSLDLAYPADAQGRQQATITAADGTAMTATTIELDEPSQRVRFVFPAPVAVGAHTLSVVFTGILNDQLCGFYRSAYVSARDGQAKFMAVTQFEATDCRRALPTWDEPAVKAIFSVTLVVEPTQAAVSNMPVTRTATILQSAEEQRADPECRGIVVPRGWIRYNFSDSPVMSSYLLAFIVGEFDYLSTFSDNDSGVPGARPVELRIYTPVGETKQGEFALDVAKKCLALYESFFQVPYPLPKLDLLAIPDFASGAMENWGAITYRDTMLLIDPENSSALIKQRCAKTISHEIAHMWFGNLVTMEWWSFLWLNEGFARYCESWAIDVLFPDWQVMDQFVNEIYGLAQSLDSLESSHPIELEVSTPDEINEVFDPINYVRLAARKQTRGASLIRMLIQTIGAPAFQRGLQIYLKDFAYKNTTSVDLWNSMSQASAEQAAAGGGIAFDIKLLMNQWVAEMGYPLLQIEEAAPTHGKSCRCFAVSQSKFLQSGKASTSGDSAVVTAGGTTWSVPLAIGSYTTQTATTLAVTQRILDKLSGVIEIEQLASSNAGPDNTIFSFNHQSTGFYRVLYAPALFSSLSTLVSKQVLPPLDRLSLLRDCFSLSTCGQGYTIANLLDLIQLFQGERNFVILQFLSIVLSNVCSLHQEQPYYPALQKMVVSIFGARWAELGWGPKPGQAKVKEHHLTFLERSTLLQMIGLYTGDASIQSHAYSLLKDFVADPVKNSIQPDLRGPVYSLSIKEGGAEARALLIQLYLSSSSSEERVRILSSLGTTRGLPTDDTKGEVIALLDWIFKSGHVRNGDLIFALATVGQDSKLSRTLCWEYIKNNWDDLLSRFKGAMFVLGRIFPSILGEMSSVAEVEEFEAFFATHPAVGAERSVKQSSETVRMKAIRLEREAPLMANFFAKA